MSRSVSFTRPALRTVLRARPAASKRFPRLIVARTVRRPGPGSLTTIRTRRPRRLGLPTRRSRLLGGVTTGGLAPPPPVGGGACPPPPGAACGATGFPPSRTTGAAPGREEVVSWTSPVSGPYVSELPSPTAVLGEDVKRALARGARSVTGRGWSVTTRAGRGRATPPTSGSPGAGGRVGGEAAAPAGAVAAGGRAAWSPPIVPGENTVTPPPAGHGP